MRFALACRTEPLIIILRPKPLVGKSFFWLLICVRLLKPYIYDSPFRAGNAITSTTLSTKGCYRYPVTGDVDPMVSTPAARTKMSPLVAWFAAEQSAKALGGNWGYPSGYG